MITLLVLIDYVNVWKTLRLTLQCYTIITSKINLNNIHGLLTNKVDTTIQCKLLLPVTQSNHNYILILRLSEEVWGQGYYKWCCHYQHHITIR